jgi:hypothetical protein
MSVSLSILFISALLVVFLWAGHVVNTRFDGGHAGNVPHIFTFLYFTLFMPAVLLTQLTNLTVGLFLFWIPAALLFGWLRVKLNWWKAATISCAVVVVSGIAMNIALMALAD